MTATQLLHAQTMRASGDLSYPRECRNSCFSNDLVFLRPRSSSILPGSSRINETEVGRIYEETNTVSFRVVAVHVLALRHSATILRPALLDKINYSITELCNVRNRNIDLANEKPATINSTVRTKPPSPTNLFRNNGTRTSTKDDVSR